MSLFNHENEKKYIFSSEVQECLDIIKEHCNLIDPREFKNYKVYCEKLFVYAASEKSDYIFAIAYYYMMLCYSSENNTRNTVSCALEGIKYQQTTEEYELLTRSYNVLAIYTNTMGNPAKAVDYFLSSIDICNEHQIGYVRCIASSNLADIFYHNSNYDRALFYYNEAENYMKKSIERQEVDHLDSLTYILCNKGYCYIANNMLDQAYDCAKQIQALAKQMDENQIYYDIFVINTFLATISYKQQKTDQMLSYLHIAKSDFHVADNYVHYMEDIEAYIDLYMNMQAYDDVLEILNYYLEKCAEDEAVFSIYSTFMERKIECVNLLNDSEEFLKCSREFFARYKNEKSAHPELIIHAENAHKESVLFAKQKYEMLLLNKKLQAESLHDILTGLPNRAYLNRYAEQTLEDALKNEIHFGIEILDIDFFKDINDKYGHLEGDRYLTALAELLQKISAENENVFTARYGGDEFVIVYYNKSSDEITTIMSDLKERVNMIRLPENSPLNMNCLSISQGAINLVPNSLNRLWDFLAHADRTLYTVKKKQKNDFLLINDFRS